MNKIKKKLPVNRDRVLAALVITLQAAAIGLIAYLVILPIYPALKYKAKNLSFATAEDFKDEETVRSKTEEFIAKLPAGEFAVSPNRLIIPKIGVNAPVVETRNADYGLSKGAWLIPDTSTPDRGGNTVITGHRFKYLPPNNLTFYLLDKLEAGDMFSVIWQGKTYYYRVKETKIVPDTELSIQDQTSDPIVTLFTCHPLYSVEKRLVVTGELLPDSAEIGDPYDL